MFRNLTFYRLPTALAEWVRMMTRDGELQQELAASPANPCGAFELQSRGWVTPYGDDSTAMFQQSGDCILFTLGGEDKVVPPAAVKAEVRKRVAEREQRDGQKLARRTVAAIKDDVMSELLPRALCKPYRLAGYLDLSECFLAVDTSSRAAAEAFVSQLRAALGTFPALPLNAEVEPRAVLTDWIASGPSLHFFLGDSATLENVAGVSGKVALSRLELEGDDVMQHIESGMKCTRLGMDIDGRLSFTLGDDLIVRKLKLSDEIVDSLDDGDRDDLRAELDARFALLSGEVRHLFRTLAGPFKFSAAGG